MNILMIKRGEYFLKARKHISINQREKRWIKNQNINLSRTVESLISRMRKNQTSHFAILEKIENRAERADKLSYLGTSFDNHYWEIQVNKRKDKEGPFWSYIAYYDNEEYNSAKERTLEELLERMREESDLLVLFKDPFVENEKLDDEENEQEKEKEEK